MPNVAEEGIAECFPGLYFPNQTNKNNPIDI